jgi:hypothetical protein
MAMDVSKAILTVDEFNHLIQVLERYARDRSIDAEVRERWQPLAENLKRLCLPQASGYTIEAVMP